ncbi:PREDICTED: protein SENESCENCE-ASSOCIATED GENE 21, mitochondrial-like isoform X1 [Ipomoea nil]|uniref:protein SENESCENCE-ASSOCIATED GENE 21, mitochondrial-like isoform X1 n=1 Tax=Ipomoea nil TaxID=35883 RepID=UPI000901EBE0|nr:PREDICTED: protein SENESCENCE-ASSOCIATED GENE 21, mitochondrial-like isoform X1 [Ipomoea nil]
MARSISNAKFVSAFVLDRVSVSATRSYTAAAAAQGSVSGVAGRSNAMLKKGGDESGKSATSWIPDPVTGYYRPESHVNEVDAAELRQMLLKNTTRQH